MTHITRRMLGAGLLAAVALFIGAACSGSDGGGSEERSFLDTDSTEDTIRDGFIAAATASGMTRDDAECMVDAIEDRTSLEDIYDMSDDELTELSFAMLGECPGAAETLMDIGAEATAEDYQPPTSAEIADASDDELWEMWGQSPSGSDVEAEIEAELEARGEW